MNNKNKLDKKNYEILLDLTSEKELEEVILNIKTMLNSDSIPKIEKDNKCKKCAYYIFCYI